MACLFKQSGKRRKKTERTKTQSREGNGPRSGPGKQRRERPQAVPASLQLDGPLGGRALCSPMPLSRTLAPLEGELYLGRKLTLTLRGVTQHPSSRPKFSMAKWQEGCPRIRVFPLNCHPSQGDSEPTPVVYWRWEGTLPSLSVHLGHPCDRSFFPDTAIPAKELGVKGEVCKTKREVLSLFLVSSPSPFLPLPSLFSLSPPCPGLLLLFCWLVSPLQAMLPLHPSSLPCIL